MKCFSYIALFKGPFATHFVSGVWPEFLTPSDYKKMGSFSSAMTEIEPKSLKVSYNVNVL